MNWIIINKVINLLVDFVWKKKKKESYIVNAKEEKLIIEIKTVKNKKS